ncbi:hypothetical protein PCASD_21629 [Puccinia coronata f. sp. avenae]|uniref:Ribosomal protein L22 n=1 Tax=Puccinia coronata f. sp. avenae TaxID=200324 RepID=A0A2N5SHK0_9BASI|nr:hypothetical protein PCASD_21629 [Puccinia coronata f. sp. avenae]
MRKKQQGGRGSHKSEDVRAARLAPPSCSGLRVRPNPNLISPAGAGGPPVRGPRKRGAVRRPSQRNFLFGPNRCVDHPVAVRLARLKALTTAPRQTAHPTPRKTTTTRDGTQVRRRTPYSQEGGRKEDRKAIARSRSNYLRVHFKNTRETAAAITGLKLAKALSFLNDVTEHKQCVPFRRFSGGVGRTAQAKAHKATQGRWPLKSAKYMIQLLKNAQANAVANELEPEDLIITSVNVNQAPKTRRRTYRAHGRINPYQGHPCHVEIVLTPVTAEVEKAEDVVVTKRRGVRAPKAIAAS